MEWPLFLYLLKSRTDWCYKFIENVLTFNNESVNENLDMNMHSSISRNAELFAGVSYTYKILITTQSLCRLFLLRS